jgi:hypothetical protein
MTLRGFEPLTPCLQSAAKQVGKNTKCFCGCRLHWKLAKVPLLKFPEAVPNFCSLLMRNRNKAESMKLPAQGLARGSVQELQTKGSLSRAREDRAKGDGLGSHRA